MRLSTTRERRLSPTACSAFVPSSGTNSLNATYRARFSLPPGIFANLDVNQKFGQRLDSSLLCIAEIVSHFDLIAIQEVNQNLHDLKRLIALLGNWWNYLVTDVTEGRAGNQERMAFLFDSRKVQFDHLAGEVALPPEEKGTVGQLARSPFLCAFRSGWRRTTICSVHIYYGAAKANEPRKVAEIAQLTGLLDKRNIRRSSEADGEPENIILLGDFNIFNKAGDETSAAMEKNHFIVPASIRRIPAGGNLARDKFYDQIAFHDPRGQLKATAKAGVFEFTQTIFGAGAAEDYVADMLDSAPEKYKAKSKTVKSRDTFYRQWRTFQISDHFPLWVEIQTDFTSNLLGSQLRRGKAPSLIPANPAPVNKAAARKARAGKADKGRVN